MSEEAEGATEEHGLVQLRSEDAGVLSPRSSPMLDSTSMGDAPQNATSDADAQNSDEDDGDMSSEADPLFAAVDLDDAADGNYDIASEPGCDSGPGSDSLSNSPRSRSHSLFVSDRDSVTVDSRSSVPLASSPNVSLPLAPIPDLNHPDADMASPTASLHLAMLLPSSPPEAPTKVQEESERTAPEKHNPEQESSSTLPRSPSPQGARLSAAAAQVTEGEEAVAPQELASSGHLPPSQSPSPPRGRAPSENGARVRRRAHSLPARPLSLSTISSSSFAPAPSGQNVNMELDVDAEVDDETTLLAQPMTHRTVVGNKRKLDAALPSDEQLGANSSLIPIKKKRPNKKNRRGGKEKGKDKDDSSKLHSTAIFSLPFELLAEIFSYLRTPDLLAMARTSKPLCHTLVTPGSEWLWRQARLRCLPNPLPDPNRIMLGLGGEQEAAATDIPSFNVTFNLVMAVLGLPEEDIDEPIVNEEGEQAAAETAPTPEPENIDVTPAADAAASSETSNDPAAPADAETSDVDPAASGSGEAQGVSGKMLPNKEEHKKPWTEWAFAAFVFDPGPCSICGVITSLSYASYGLRYRRCGRPHCKVSHTGLAAPTTSNAALLSALPHEKLLAPPSTRVYGQKTRRYYRKKDYDNELARYNAATKDPKMISDLEAEWRARAPHAQRLNKLSQSLLTWRAAYDKSLSKVRGTNDTAWKKIANDRKMSRQDMVNSDTLQRLLRESCYRLKPISREEWTAHTDAIVKEAQILNIRRLQRESEQNLLIQRAAMDVFYSSLRVHSNAAPSDSSPLTSSAIPILPPLSEFRKLPAISLLMGSKDTSEHMSVEKAMQDADHPLMAIVRLEISRWVSTMKARLGAVLHAGSSLRRRNSTSNASPVNPKRENAYIALVDRPSVFFLCSLCASHRNQSAPYASGEGIWCGLTFEGVAQHECRGAWAAGGVEWSIEQFAPDWVAIAAVKEVLSKAGIDEDATDIKGKMAAIERRIRCETCEGKVIVPLKDIVRHARRHDEFTCRITTSPQTSVLGKTTERFIHADGPAVHERTNIKKYGCKHCAQSKRSLSFNGLRSHLKAKHGYDHIGDEDFYVRKDNPVQAKLGRVVSVSGDGR